MPDWKSSNPEKEQVELLLTGANVVVSNFDEYSFNSHFLTPTDGFSFVISAEKLAKDVRAALKPGAAVQLTLNGGVQATGYIDSIEIVASRDSGTVFRIEGRDSLAQAVDSHADPTVSLKEGQTLAQGLKTLFTPYGWSEDSQFVISADADREVRTQKYRAKTKKSDAKGFGRRGLREYKLHQLRPYPSEGVFAFASRLAQRFGLWIWPSADGKQLIVSTPSFTQEPEYVLSRDYLGNTNVLDGSVKFDVSEQPTVIVADGYSQGGEFGRGRIKTVTANTAVFTSDSDFLKPYQTYVKAGAKVLDTHSFATPLSVPRNRTVFLVDNESQTQEQLDNFVRRELALMQRKSLTVHYTVEGHGQVSAAGFRPWSVDTTVMVRDDIAELHETLYVLSRTFSKSRSSGTTTTLELIRLNTLSFSDTGK